MASQTDLGFVTESQEGTPTFAPALIWLVVGLVALLVGVLTQSPVLGGAAVFSAVFSAGISAALFINTTRKKLRAGRPNELLQAQLQQLQSDLEAAQTEITRLREEHEFDRQLGAAPTGEGTRSF